MKGALALDVFGPSDYLACVNRILLALVALLTGLAANTVPAQARMAATGTEIGALHNTAAVLRCAEVVVAARRSSAPQISVAAPLATGPASGYSPVSVPSVQLQADRAHE